MKSEIKTEFYDHLFKILVPLIIAVGSWYLKSQSSEISELTKAINQSVIQQRELFIKIENFEKHLMRSDQTIQTLEQRMSVIELKIERFDEKLMKERK